MSGSLEAPGVPGRIPGVPWGPLGDALGDKKHEKSLLFHMNLRVRVFLALNDEKRGGYKQKFENITLKKVLRQEVHNI